MPYGVYKVTDSRTGKTYKIPWDDPTKRPTDAEAMQFINEQENKSLSSSAYEWANKPLTDLPSRASKYISEPLYKYGESTNSPLATASRYAGATAEALGDIGDQIFSPFGLVTTVGPGAAGKLAAKGLPLAAGLLGRTSQAAGALQAAHGGYGMTQAQTGGEFASSLLEAGSGALGMRSPLVSRAEKAFGGTRAPKGLPEISIKEPNLSRTGSVTRKVRPLEGDILGEVKDAELLPEPRQLPPPNPPRGARRTWEPKAGPFYAGRTGVSESLDDVLETADLAKTPAESAFYSMIPDRYKPNVTSANMSAEGLRETGPWKFVPSMADEVNIPPTETSKITVRQRMSRFGKKATKTKAEKEAESLLGDFDEVKVPNKWKGQEGFIDIPGFIEGFKELKEKVKGSLKSKTAEKLLGREVSIDPGELPLKGGWQSGWGYLESAGEPGKKIARLLSKARADFEKLAESRGDPNKVGKDIWAYHKDEINDLLKQIDDPQKAKKAKAVIDIQLGLHQPSPNKVFQSSVDFAKKIQAATKLSQFPIQNPVTIANIFMRGNVGASAKAVANTLFKSEKSYEIAKKSGALRPLLSEISRDIGETAPGKDVMTKAVTKAFGIEKSEKMVRTMAALSGRGTASDLFKQLKANPANKLARSRLDDLILEDIDQVLKQKSLTPDQLDRASSRMSELTQSRAESIDLPPLWSGHPIVDLATQFKRYGYSQTRNIKESFKRDPVRTTTALLTVLPLMGELVGDAKASIAGVAKEGKKSWDQGSFDKADFMRAVQDEIKGRGTGLDRYLADMEQAWAFGLFADLYRASGRGPTGLIEYAGGPTGSDISKGASATRTLIDTGRKEPLERELMRKVPYVGNTLANEIQGSYRGRQGRRARTRERRPTRGS